MWRRGGLGERVGKGDGGERWGEWGERGIRRGRGRTARGGLGLCWPYSGALQVVYRCQLFLNENSFRNPKITTDKSYGLTDR